jgi:hypothetical protein
MILEKRKCPVIPTSMLLVRIMIGKVEDGNQLVEILRTTPVPKSQPEWNCVSRVKEALETLEADSKALARESPSGQSCAARRWVIANGRKISIVLMARATLI